MDKISKALKKLLSNEKKSIEKILVKLKRFDFSGLDVKKLKGREDIYRAHKGDLRIIFYYSRNKDINILALERRSDNTYKN
jgi:mRNA-degrading endonuclease RelE of RelBE toxin-antitoxin system